MKYMKTFEDFFKESVNKKDELKKKVEKIFNFKK